MKETMTSEETTLGYLIRGKTNDNERVVLIAALWDTQQ